MKDDNFDGAPPPYLENIEQKNIKQSSIHQVVSKMFYDIGSTFDSTTRDLIHIINGKSKNNLLPTCFWTGNVIQISPKKSNTCIQILSNLNGHLFLDPLCPLPSDAYNSHWTVFLETGFEDIVRLNNQLNYIAIEHKELKLIKKNDGDPNPLSTRFRIRQKDGCISFESLLCPKYYITFDSLHNVLVAKDVSLFSLSSFFHITIVNQKKTINVKETKENVQRAQEPVVLAKDPVVLFKEAAVLVKEPVVLAKEPLFIIKNADKWKCPMCECQNIYELLFCEACDNAGSHLYKWRCRKCTFFNENEALNCYVCGAVNEELPK